jgi:endonuclease/exonuclease/phosphatase family metal-dependent hydrolase
MVVLLLSGCNNDDRPRNNAIRVLCVNIHAKKANDGESNLDALAELINQLAPDFVALQEVDVNTFRSGGIDMPERLAEKTGMHYAFGKAMDHSAGQYGNAILSITSLEQVENIALPQGQEPRSALKANANIDGKLSINIISTHFDSRDEDSRINSASQLNEKFATGHSLSLLIGDLNDIPTSTTISTLASNWALSDPNGESPTFPARNPTKKIDYIMYYPTNAWKVLDYQVIEDTNLSVHRPYFVTLEILQ